MELLGPGGEGLSRSTPVSPAFRVMGHHFLTFPPFVQVAPAGDGGPPAGDGDPPAGQGLCVTTAAARQADRLDVVTPSQLWDTEAVFTR